METVLDPSAVLYFDVRNYDMMTPTDGDDKGNADANDQTRFLMGVEYYF